MANSATNIDTISQSQALKETKANEYFDAASPATLFGRRASTSSGLTWGYYGGTINVDGVLTQIANGTLSLTGGTVTNYVEATRAGVISTNTSGFTAGRIPLYEIPVSAGVISSYTDYRAWVEPAHLTRDASFSVTSADVTLTAAQARCRYLVTTGVLTGNRNVILPDRGEWIVFCNNTGAFTTTFKTSGGSGIVVAQTKRAILYADGTNVVRVTADA